MDGLSQRSILALVACCLCSLGSGFFLCVEKKLLLQTSCNEGGEKKRKKLTEQEMMTQLYGNHFRTRTRTSEPGSSGTHEEVWMEFSSFQSCLTQKRENQGRHRGQLAENFRQEKPGLPSKIYFKVTVLHIHHLKTRPHILQRHLFIHTTQNTNSAVTVSHFSFIFMSLQTRRAGQTGV